MNNKNFTCQSCRLNFEKGSIPNLDNWLICPECGGGLKETILDSKSDNEKIQTKIEPKDNNKANGLSKAILSFLAPFAFSFSTLIGLFLGALSWCYLSLIIWFYGLFLSISTLKNSNASDGAKQFALVGFIFSIISGTLFLFLCSFTNSYGPYSGIVIDKESGEPITGAVIVMEVCVVTPHAAGGTSSHYFGTETITDLLGRFHIPKHRLFKANLLTQWDNEQIEIFKPGFSCYPGKGSKPWFVPSGTLPTNKNVIISLTKLKAKKRKGTQDCSFDHDVIDKLYVASRYYDQNRLDNGFEPFQLKNYYRVKHNLIFKRKQKTIYDYPQLKKAISSYKHISPEERIKIEAERKKIKEENYQMWLKTSKMPKKKKIMHPFFLTGAGYSSSYVDINYEKYGEPAYRIYNALPELQNELALKLKNEKIDFIIERKNLNQIIILLRENQKNIDAVIESVYNKPHMLFLNKEKKDLFITLLQEQNIPYILRTVPNVIGYDVIWDYENNNLVEKQKLIFFNQIISGE